MTPTTERLVGNSFRSGYRYQRYWDTSMALAFFCAEVGAGLFAVSLYLDRPAGMIAGLALALILKPYFHLAHMGVPAKSWRALARPDRSWISRGALAIGALALFGIAQLLMRLYDAPPVPALDAVVRYGALAAAAVVMCYQGFAMADSESFALWASPLVPLSSFLYALTAGVLLASLAGAADVQPGAMALPRLAGEGLLLLDLAVLLGLLALARRKSRGGAFSVGLLLNGRFAPGFRYLVLLVGLVVPLAILVAGGEQPAARLPACASMLIGFYALRILLFRAAVYEPITYRLAAGIGLPGRP